MVLVGGIGEYEHIWRMAYVRGPQGIIVSMGVRYRWSGSVGLLRRWTP